jgi:4'-phosphopantetheinyl transferase EntD
VVVALSSAARSVGLDLERDVAESKEAEAEILRRVCGTAAERRQATLLRQTAKSPGTLFLSAKEAFFKFQFPLTRAQLDWADVEVNMEDHRFRARAPGRPGVPSGAGIQAVAAGWQASVCY